MADLCMWVISPLSAVRKCRWRHTAVPLHCVSGYPQEHRRHGARACEPSTKEADSDSKLHSPSSVHGVHGGGGGTDTDSYKLFCVHMYACVTLLGHTHSVIKHSTPTNWTNRKQRSKYFWEWPVWGREWHTPILLVECKSQGFQQATDRASGVVQPYLSYPWRDLSQRVSCVFSQGISLGVYQRWVEK